MVDRVGDIAAGANSDSARGVISGHTNPTGELQRHAPVDHTGPPQQAAQLATTFSVVPPQLYITGTVPDKWPLGVPVQWSAAIQGGTPPYQWNAASGSLPPGLNFDPNTGDVAGIPTTLGQYNFTLSATDSGSPPQTANSSFWANVTTPLGRNDTIAHATPVSDGSWLASISPYADPPDSSTPVPDTDYYKIMGSANTVVKVWTGAQSIWWNTPVDTVLEIVDTNGVRLNTCRLPGDPSFYYNSPCLNDDIAQGTYRDSQLEVKLPGQGNTLTTFYAHVFDWRGDARPDMQYYLNVSGSIQPLQAQPAGFAYFGQGQQSKTGCVVNLACYIQFQATGGSQPLTWSVASGNIPPGMAMDPQFGAVKGTPAVTGTYSFAARASDASSPPQTVDIPFTLTVEPPVAILTTSLPNGTVGQSYSFTLNGTGGTPPLTWQAGAPDYNFTLQMNGSTGVLSGIPRVAGTFPVNVIATDSVGVYAFASFPFTALPGPLTFPGGSYGNGKVGIQYADATPYLNAYGGALPISISLIGGTVPPGLSFSGGELKGIPTTAGTYSLQLQATDSSSPTPQTQTATYTITITP